MKKTALVISATICAIFSLLAFESQIITLVKGNATFPSGSISVKAQKTVYYSSTITLTYHAVFPSYFGNKVWGRKWIVYSLDSGQNFTVYDEYNDLESYSGSVTLSGLSSGWHTLRIYSKNGTFWWGTSYRGWSDAEDTASFAIDLSGKSPAPTSASTPSPVPTPEPSVTPYGEADVQNASQYLASGGMVAVTVAVVCAGLGLLVYLIKKNNPLKQNSGRTRKL